MHILNISNDGLRTRPAHVIPVWPLGGDLLTARSFVAWAYCSQTWETLQGSQRTCSYQASLYFYSGKKGHKRNNITVSIEFRSPGRHWAREHSELLPQSLLSVSNLAHLTSSWQPHPIHANLPVRWLCHPLFGLEWVQSNRDQTLLKGRRKSQRWAEPSNDTLLPRGREETDHVWSLHSWFIPGLHELSL